MLFTSSEFFVLLAITFVIYYLLRKEGHQKLILIISSFVFYAWNFPKLLILLCVSIAINILTVKAIKNGEASKRYWWATLGVIINLGILAFFKYSPLLGKTFFAEGSEFGQFLVSIPLPIGISFFTFQGLSLVVDTYRARNNDDNLPEDNKSLVESIALYIGFFPQLIAGPIVKAYEFLPQIKGKLLKDIDWEYCVKQLILGYFLKMVIADNLKDHTFWMQYPYFMELSGLNLLALLFGYSMQIFSDFAGYSLIALGLAGLFGYRLRDNFMFPYISSTFSEFWRRWHISLSTFLREYLYIPLGGNRKGKVRTYFNLMITMVLGGFWHGAAWSYAVWGAAHGIALAVERLMGDYMPFNWPKGLRFIKVIFIFSVVTLLWLLFRLPAFSEVILYVQQISLAPFFKGLDDLNTVFFIGMYSLPILAYHLIYLLNEKEKRKWFVSAEPVMYGALLFFILVNSGSSGSFIYFQF
ncbi:MBOAT family O-acyltransferase [Jiulongibacter sp. NS-SX5]|uniref:MBOAT family O-acyltransferase n=1 Tax=Jiulongibacter sp. NS-SX5 TaxID=3463854 RepID=UPI0040588D5B